MSNRALSPGRKRILSTGLKSGIGIEDIAIGHAIPISLLRDQVSAWRERNMLRLIFDLPMGANRRALEIMGIAGGDDAF